LANPLQIREVSQCGKPISEFVRDDDGHILEAGRAHTSSAYEKDLETDNVAIRSATLSYYFLLALFPLLAPRQKRSKSESIVLAPCSGGNRLLHRL
jgi:hypothetical protein